MPKLEVLEQVAPKKKQTQICEHVSGMQNITLEPLWSRLSALEPSESEGQMRGLRQCETCHSMSACGHFGRLDLVWLTAPFDARMGHDKPSDIGLPKLGALSDCITDLLVERQVLRQSEPPKHL